MEHRKYQILKFFSKSPTHQRHLMELSEKFSKYHFTYKVIIDECVTEGLLTESEIHHYYDVEKDKMIQTLIYRMTTKGDDFLENKKWEIRNKIAELWATVIATLGKIGLGFYIGWATVYQWL